MLLKIRIEAFFIIVLIMIIFFIGMSIIFELLFPNIDFELISLILGIGIIFGIYLDSLAEYINKKIEKKEKA